jgi:hypothetical protein
MRSGLVLSTVLLVGSCASTSERAAPSPLLHAANVASTPWDVIASSAPSAPSMAGDSNVVSASCNVSAPSDASASANASAPSMLRTPTDAMPSGAIASRGPAPLADADGPDGLETETSLLTELYLHPNATVKATDEASEAYPDRFMLRAGLFYFSRLRTTASLDAKNAPVGATIDFDRTLGLDTSNVSGRVDSYYRFTEYQAIGASWYRFRLSGSRVIDKDIEWNGMTYPVNAQVDSFFDQDIYKLNYRLSFYHNPDIEFGRPASTCSTSTSA